MPAIPLPFITAFLLIVLFLRIRHINGKARSTKTETAFIAASCLTITLCGFHWGTSLSLPAFFQPIVAASVPPLFWLCAKPVNNDSKPLVRYFRHLLPVIGVALLVTMRAHINLPLLDLSLLMIYAGYGTALVHSSCAIPSASPRWKKIRFLAGVYFICSGMADIAIALDLEIFGGRRAPGMIAAAHIATLIVLTLLIVTTDPSLAETAEKNRDGVEIQPASPEDRALADKLDQLIRTHNLYTDPTMTIQRLARRLGIPTRQLSEAINRVYGRNISQIMNGYRINEARRLLSQTDSRIIDIMLACGFQTKSNFNREFLKFTGMSPSHWRRANTSSTSASSAATSASESR
ncbi:helix-turn-helix domain-containing protein [Brenneria izbisi]|uniref:AraC family transcriptional regulator n=1 Tax=Brenneria izbisi TaxID=2939450 RepID=A0AA42C2G1_9GAMM|nr:AraC family transcriptional regulator [Brenneria izbisi]MCV9879218.1 AraC family transcriptional regulator [Brenneria izbisi]MCV9882748.1 AraC family transcriptional regulator [Brenneria izbisi]